MPLAATQPPDHLHGARLGFHHTNVRNADSGPSGFSDPGGGSLSLGLHHTSGIHLGLEDTGGALEDTGGPLGEHLCVLESKVELAISLEDRPLFSIWDPDLLFGICFPKLLLNHTTL